jgi:hypothetical protein
LLLLVMMMRYFMIGVKANLVGLSEWSGRRKKTPDLKTDNRIKPLLLQSVAGREVMQP